MSSDPSRAKSVFLEAVEQYPPDQWPQYLDQACGEDLELRQRVETLLSAHQRAEQLTAEGAAAFQAIVPVLQVPDGSESAGTQIGPYTLQEKLGEGGMGVVFLAQQQEPVQRQVALKIIRPGMDTQRVIARFDAERQALSVMDHPHVAKVLDAGTTDSGRPYFVMELVQGIAITKYCDQHELPIRKRLELFIPVCQAVQHAHQKGIIHRDIKPSNILVAEFDGRPVPKVIDFGVAKAIDQRTAQKQLSTQYGQIVGTLEYMSPEQARLSQHDVDTRSDIYSLGAVLYELLTGITPFDKQRLYGAAFDQALHMIEAEEPLKPSQRLSDSDTLPSVAALRHIEPQRLTGLIQGELDWIVMKALEKERARRYETATSLAQDIEHYLRDEPVLAGPPSRAYRFRKFARRNKAALVTTALVVASLVLGLVGTSWQAIRAQQQAIRAQQQAERADQAADEAKTEAAIARAVNDFLTEDLLAQADPENEPDRDIKLRTIVDRASLHIEGRFADQPLVAAAIHGMLGKIYHAMGEYDEAERHVEQARAIWGHVLGPEDPKTLRSRGGLGVIRLSQGRHTAAANLQAEVLGIQLRVLGSEHPDTIMTMRNLAAAYFKQGRYEESKNLYTRALKTGRRALGPEHRNTLSSMGGLATVCWTQGHYDEAEELLVPLIESYRRTLGAAHPNTLQSMNQLGLLRTDQGQYESAEKLLAELVELDRRVLGPAHPNTLIAINNLALVYTHEKRLEAALLLYEETLSLLRQRLGPSHPKTLECMNNLSGAYWEADRRDDALLLWEETLKLQRETLGPEHPSTLRSMHNLAVAYEGTGRRDDALSLGQETFKLMKARLGPRHPTTLISMNNLAGTYLDAGRMEEALPLFEEAAKCFREELGPAHQYSLKSMGNLARAHRRAGQLDVAMRLQEETAKLAKAELGPKHPLTLTSINDLAVTYGEAGRLDTALALLEETVQRARAELGLEHSLTLKSMHNLARLYLDAGSPQQGLPPYEQIVAARRNRAQVDGPELADLLSEVGCELLAHQEPSPAEPYLRECLRIREKAMEGHWLVFNTKSMLGAALAGQATALLATDKEAALKRLVEAEPLLIEGYEGMQARETTIPAQVRARLTEALQRLVDLYTAWEKPDEATKWQAKLDEAKADSEG